MSILKTLKSRIDSKDVQAAVIGLGYVGLPLAHAICNAGIKVLGVDIDPEKIKILKGGKSYIDAVEDGWIKKWLDQELFEPTNDYSALKKADFIIICVPTPLDKDSNPDLGYVEKTAQEIAAHLKPAHVVVLESTTYPGTTTEVVKPILEAGELKSGIDFYLAYSPERENPGSKNFSTGTIPKVIGADEPEALEVAKSFYELFIEQMVPVSSTAVAEASKIMENVFRATNIALVNELKLIFERMDLDIWEVIEAVETKPFGYMPFYPGPGLGGHCIPVDPFYLSWKAEQCGIPTEFIELAGKINTAMPGHVVSKTLEALQQKKGKPSKESHLLVLGIAYKKNVADQRETPAFPVIDSLIKQGARVDFHDPHIPQIKPNRNYPDLTGKKSIEWDPEKLKSYDGFIIITDHDDVKYQDLLKCPGIIVDTRNAFKNETTSDQIIKA